MVILTEKLDEVFLIGQELSIRLVRRVRRPKDVSTNPHNHRREQSGQEKSGLTVGRSSQEVMERVPGVHIVVTDLLEMTLNGDGHRRVAEAGERAGRGNRVKDLLEIDLQDQIRPPKRQPKRIHRREVGHLGDVREVLRDHLDQEREDDLKDEVHPEDQHCSGQ